MTVNQKSAIQGIAEERFSAVRDAFIRNFEDRGEIGACVSVTVDGKAVVDLWGGHIDRGRRKP